MHSFSSNCISPSYLLRGTVLAMALPAASLVVAEPESSYIKSAVGPYPATTANIPIARGDKPEALDATIISESAPRANNILDAASIATTAEPGTTPLLLLNRLPSVNVNTSNTFGIRTSDGSSLRLRAFSLNALALSVDGIPTPYSNALAGASNPNRFIDAENLANVIVAPGTGDVTTPSYSALGGSINFYTRAPEQQESAQVNGTYGTGNLHRVFARVDTGVIAKGVTAFVSGSNVEQLDSFGSLATNQRKEYDAKVRWVTPTATLTASYTYSNADDHDDRTISGAYYGKWVPYVPVNATGAAATGTLGQLGDLTDRGRNWYYSAVQDGNPNGLDSIFWNKNVNQRIQNLVSVNGTFTPINNLTIEVIPYYQDVWGRNYGAVSNKTALTFYANAELAYFGQTGQFRNDIVAPTNTNAAFNTADFLDAYVLGTPSQRTALINTTTSLEGAGDEARRSINYGHREGVPVHVTWDLTNQTVKLGGWFEHDQENQTRKGYNVVNGINANDFILSEPWTTYSDNHFDTHTYQLFAEDTVRLLDEKLHLTGGIKSLDQSVTYHGSPDNLAFYNLYAGGYYNTKFSFSDYLQPQLGATYALTEGDELFFNFSKNFSAVGYDVIGSTSFQQNPSALNPERTNNYDFGWRTTKGAWTSSLAGYYIQYQNRVGSIAAYDPLGFGSASTTTPYANLGRVTGYGGEFAFAYKPIEDFRIDGALSYQRLTYQDNYQQPGAKGQPTTVVIKGNTVPNTPKWTFSSDATYFAGPFFAGVNVRFSDWVYLSTDNGKAGGYGAQVLPGYILFGLNLGYDGIARKGRFKNVRIALNIDNLFDRYWFYSAGGNSYGNGNFGVGLPRATYLTVSTKF